MLNPLFNLVAQSEAGAESSESAVPAAPPYQYGDYFFPVKASSFAGEIDYLYWAILWISTFFFVLIIGLMVYFAWKYRRRPGHEKALPSTSHNTPLEILWSVLPSIILVWIFVTGANGFFKMKVIPEASEEIWVTAQQFNWSFTYPDGDQTPNELHLVVNKPAKFTMESRDVLHAFFVPAFRQKQDIVPGRYTYTWVTPTKIGVFRLYCAEYCGDGHSLMKANVRVHATEEDRKAATKWDWEGLAETNPAKNGERLYRLNCSGCHNINGVRSTGPAFNGIYGKTEELLSGPRIVDETYIRESILDPNKEIVSGFSKPSQMQSFQGQLNDEQLKWLILYIKSLKDK